MAIIALDHIQLAMPEGGEGEARLFYAGVLGLEEIPKPQNLAVRGGVWFGRGTVKVHLGIDKDFVPARKAHPGFLVDDLDATIEQILAHGVGIREDEPLEGYSRVYISDPFGNRIELMERTAKAR
ncbi:MAG TPA: VOC family protein [Devosiaceae bacterium]|nr:VOC family protein [Devosiaceae bacterium]